MQVRTERTGDIHFISMSLNPYQPPGDPDESPRPPADLERFDAAQRREWWQLAAVVIAIAAAFYAFIRF